MTEQVFGSNQNPSGDDFFRRLSVDVKRALFFARRAVSCEGGFEVGTLHLLVGVIYAAPASLSGALAPATPDDLLQRILPIIRSAEKHDESEELPFSSSLVTVFKTMECDQTRLITPTMLVQEAWRLDSSVRTVLDAFGMTQAKIDTLQ